MFLACPVLDKVLLHGHTQMTQHKASLEGPLTILMSCSRKAQPLPSALLRWLTVSVNLLGRMLYRLNDAICERSW